jgi:hypothetical protein
MQIIYISSKSKKKQKTESSIRLNTSGILQNNIKPVPKSRSLRPCRFDVQVLHLTDQLKSLVRKLAIPIMVVKSFI